MKQRKWNKPKRIPLKVVGIRITIKKRLDNYLDSLSPRPPDAEIVSLAVEEYLQRQGA